LADMEWSGNVIPVPETFTVLGEHYQNVMLGRIFKLLGDLIKGDFIELLC